jgi:Fibronectin type III domain
MAMPVAFVATVATSSAAGAVGNPPGAPTAVTARIGNTQALLSFTPPASIGGSAITGYDATCTGGTTAGTGHSTASPLTVNNMTNGGTYMCTVTASNNDGPGPPSAPTLSFVPAPVPDAPTIGTATLGDMSATVTFAANGAGGHPITSFTTTCTPVGGGTAVLAAGPSPVAVTGLTNGTAYTCTVFATNADGDSFLSAPSNTFTPARAPDAPAVAATTGNAFASVVITPGSNNGSAVTLYTVSCTGPSGNPGSVSAATAANPIVVTGLTNGILYSCTVIATNSIGPSQPGTSNSFTPTTTKPDPPTAVVVSPGPAPVATSWSVAFTPPANDGGDSGGIIRYTVSCISTDGGIPGTPTNGPSSPIVVTALTAGNTYKCTVTATNAVGQSDPSVASAAFSSPTAPRAPTAVVATPQSGGASVAFTPGVTGGSTVTYFATCASSDGGTNFGVFTGTASPITVLNLTNGKTYTCTVTAQNSTGSSPASDPSPSFVVSAIPGAPGPPTIGTAAIDSQSATVSFTAGNPGSSPILSFTVTCSSTNGGVTTSATDVTSPIFVFGLTNGRTYTCAALETNSAGASLYSGHTTAFVVGVVPGAPRSPSARPGNAGATVSWTAPASNGGAPITGYVVTPYLGAAAQAARTFAGAATTVAVNGLLNGKTYTFVVVAKNGIGAGAASSPTAPVLIGTPAAPRSVVAQPGLSSAKVSWAPPATPNGGAITGYVVIPYANGVAKPALTFKSLARTQTIGHLANGVAYAFRVVAVNHFGQGAMSTPSPAIKVGVPTAPTGVRAQKGPSDSLLVSFTASNPNGSPITKYTVVCTSTNGGVTLTKASAVTLVQFKTPSRKKIYVCTVSATNARGTGPTSAPSGAIQTA